MRILTFLLFSLLVHSQRVTVYQINAEWNAKNTLELNLKNCKYIYADIDDLAIKIKSQIKSLPTILIYKEGKNRRQYMAGIDMKLNVREEEIQNFINSLNDKEL
jgi:hypothetical protein